MHNPHAAGEKGKVAKKRINLAPLGSVGFPYAVLPVAEEAVSF
jgi:hypothetical protein